MKSILFSTAAVLGVLSATVAAAQPAAAPDVAGAESSNAVRGVIVTANRAPAAAAEVAQAVTVIDRAQIEASQAILLPDLLGRTAGVTLSRNGGPGGVTALRIRGAESDQTLVVIDGVRLNDVAQPGAGYNFANLLTGDVARVEVLRGAQSTLWGSQAIGGVVNVITTVPTAPFQASLDVEGGDNATAYVRGGVGGASERLVWRLGAGYYTTDGVSAVAGGAEDDGFQHTSANGRLGVKITDNLSLDLRGVYSYGRAQVDGYPAPAYSFADTAEYGVTEELVGYVGLNLALLDERLRNRLAYSRTRTDRQSLNPAQAVTDVTFDALSEVDRWEYQGSFALTPAWQAVFGLEREEAAMRTLSPSAFNPNPPAQAASADLDSAYLQLQGPLLAGLTVTAGVRRDEHDTFGGQTLGQGALAWSLNGGDTVLRASLGQGFKAPSLYQLYSEYGNLALDPEEADAWDLGVEQSLAGGLALVSATWFQRKTTNQIDYVSCFSAPADPLCRVGGSTRFGYYSNTARTEAHGVELTGQAKVGPFDLAANYTWTDATNESAGSANRGNQLARRPEHQGYMSLTHVWTAGPTATLAVRYIGEAFDDAANLNRLEPRALLDLRAAWPLSDTFEVYGRVENVFDDRAPSTRGYGELGRFGALGLRARF
ncbi:TonB-dependent siderophore receptor [Phenylobacterium sp.]|uniref:TonB-dependent receptor plug domain-containing protein n=1 Tax=Phenylobacterium sp. TaxID=1871053 RepID=UPI0027315C44|nr:TonB-dependent receptor [Phenylobacterium sp.]MDP1872551.1 TonB-dependent receptor [Phenylobacterium sp.]